MPQDRPFLVRNRVTGGEYEMASIEDFNKVYGDNPDWVIETGPYRTAPAVSFESEDVVVDDDEDFVDEDDE